MTAPSMFDRLSDMLGVSGTCELSRHLGIHDALIRKARQSGNLTLKTMHRIHVRTRVPIGILAEWWLEGQDAASAMRPHERVHGLTPEIEERLFGQADAAG